MWLRACRPQLITDDIFMHQYHWRVLHHLQSCSYKQDLAVTLLHRKGCDQRLLPNAIAFGAALDREVFKVCFYKDKVLGSALNSCTRRKMCKFVSLTRLYGQRFASIDIHQIVSHTLGSKFGTGRSKVST